jgi:low affinity Fe/Cu permease
MKDIFHKIAHRTSEIVGSAGAFIVAMLIIVTWAITGPIFGFSDTWQLIINTGTTIITFLVVFLIQNTQNRDSKVVQLKLDELIRATKNARTRLVDLEDLTEDEIKNLELEFQRLRKRSKRGESRPKGEGEK